MEANVDEIARELATLTQRFADLGASLDEAARALEEAGAPPPAGLLEALDGARGQFVALRAEALNAAAAAGVAPASEPESLHELGPVLAAITDALQARARRQALEDAQQTAVTTLDRVLEIVHGDEPQFPALVACHSRAHQVRAAVLALTELDSEPARQVIDTVRAFGALLAMVDNRDALDDDQYAQLEQSVSRGFGRPLAVAAGRGRLGFPGDFPEPSAPSLEPTTAGAAEPPIASPPGETDLPAPVAAELSVRPPIPEPVSLDPSPEESAEEAEPEPVPAPEPLAVTEAPAAAEPKGDTSGADETAQWWLAAWARWSGWKSRQDFPTAARDELGKYPYLLSVPIQKSPQYEDGLLAYGYSILMDHVEKQNPGCVGNALNSLKPGQSRPVGEQLYEYLIAAGRLRETYADFVSDTLAAVLPDPAVWFQFRILESKEDTRILQRPTARLGDTELSGQRLAGDGQRYNEHKFKMTLGPLTTRFILVSADVREARGAGFRVVADGTPCDSGWVASVPAGSRATAKMEIKRIGADGLYVPGLGKDYAALWVAVFNADPAADRPYELSVFLRKDTQSPFRAKG
jgi:hypothetical protein